jgi:hypothetical protein
LTPCHRDRTPPSRTRKRWSLQTQSLMIQTRAAQDSLVRLLTAWAPLLRFRVAQSPPPSQGSGDRRTRSSPYCSHCPRSPRKTPSEPSASAKSPLGSSASSASPSQSPLMRLGLFLQICSSGGSPCLDLTGSALMGGPSWWHCRGPSSPALPPSRSPTCFQAQSIPSTALFIHALANLWPFTLTSSSSGPPKRA